MVKENDKWKVFEFLNNVSSQKGNANFVFAEKIIEIYVETQKSL